MKTVRHALFAAALFCAGGACGAEETLEPFVLADAPDPLWLADYARARDLARQQHKLILLNFTGSDWNTWAQQIRTRILAQKHFLEYAGQNLILVELDFPRNVVQSKATREQNALLLKQFSVTLLPAFVVVDPDGRELGRTGYMQGGPKTFVRELKRFAAKANPGEAVVRPAQNP